MYRDYFFNTYVQADILGCMYLYIDKRQGDAGDHSLRYCHPKTAVFEQSIESIHAFCFALTADAGA